MGSVSGIFFKCVYMCRGGGRKCEIFKLTDFEPGLTLKKS